MKIVWRTIVAIAAVVFAGVLTFQLPQVQTFLAAKVTESLSKKLDGDISFEKLHIKPFTTLVLKNAVITDRNPAQDLAWRIPWTEEPGGLQSIALYRVGCD